MGIIPNQTVGGESDTISEKKFDSAIKAKEFFILLKEKLLNVNKWKDYAGTLSASFQLCDIIGDEVQRNVEPGDFIRINIPGPGSKTGDGFDWVKVETVKEENKDDEEKLFINVRPASNPLNINNDIAHFFNEAATSTFLLKRNENKVIAEVHGRNELPNTDAEAIPDKIRNTFMATAATTGFSKFQWKLLTEGLLKDI